jgi:hypothetical protein
LTYFKLDISLLLIYSVVNSDRGIKKVAWRITKPPLGYSPELPLCIYRQHNRLFSQGKGNNTIGIDSCQHGLRAQTGTMSRCWRVFPKFFLIFTGAPADDDIPGGKPERNSDYSGKQKPR